MNQLDSVRDVKKIHLRVRQSNWNFLRRHLHFDSSDLAGQEVALNTDFYGYPSK
jgi:hypothetical protein